MPKLTKISIILPTRERLETLKWSLQTLLAQRYEALEIIVSDNFSSDGTQEYVTSLVDKRLRYFNTGKRIGMSQNWEYGLEKATGDWVGFIGDDDGLLPNACLMLHELIVNHRVDAIRTRACSYVWPNAQPANQNIPMNVPLGKSSHIRNGTQWLAKVASSTANYSELPMLYNGGFVRRELLVEFARMHGRVFLSRIPDVFSGALIAHLAGEYLYSTAPIAINGTSVSSTGYSYFKKPNDPSGAEEPAKLFSQEDNLPFHPSIPLSADGSIPKSLLALVFESMAHLKQCAPEIRVPSPEIMLRHILAAPHTMDDQQLHRWLDSFKQTHHLDANYLPARLGILRLWFRLKFLWYRLGLVWNSHFQQTDQPALLNIYSAANAAYEISQKQSLNRFQMLSHAIGHYKRSRSQR